MNFPDDLSRIEWVDISRPLGPGAPVWPGDAPTRFEVARHSSKDLDIVTTTLRMSLHAGTHLDAPCHFLADGMTIDRFPVPLVLGSALVVDAAGVSSIGPEILPPLGSGRRILFRTTVAPPETSFPEHYAFIEPEAAARLRDAGAALVGLDAPSVDPFDSTDYPAHRILLGGGIFLLENLRLDHVSPGEYLLLLAPLPLQGAEASPVRPFLGRIYR